MYIFAVILLHQSATIGRQKHRNRVRSQHDPGRQGTGQAKHSGIAHTRILQIDVFHQVVQGHVGVVAGRTRESR